MDKEKRDCIAEFIDELVKPERLEPYKLKNGAVKFKSDNEFFCYMAVALNKMTGRGSEKE